MILYVLGREYEIADKMALALLRAGFLYWSEAGREGEASQLRIAPDLPDYVEIEGKVYREGAGYLEGIYRGISMETPLEKAAREVVASWWNGGVFCNGRNNTVLSTLERTLENIR